jgi:hypothetical protein
MRSRPMIDHFPLPIQGKPERRHLYRWVKEEEEYVHGKFDDQRQGHDNSFHDDGMAGFWTRQIVQYLDRANDWLVEAAGCRSIGNDEDGRILEMKAQQAICKAMMTAKGCAESSIRVFGPLPRPGLSSSAGVQPWETGAILLEREIEARG